MKRSISFLLLVISLMIWFCNGCATTEYASERYAQGENSQIASGHISGRDVQDMALLFQWVTWPVGNHSVFAIAFTKVCINDVTLSYGDKIGNYKVEKMSEDSVTLSGKEGNIELSLDHALYIVSPSHVFMKEFSETLEKKEYANAEKMRLKRINDIDNLLNYLRAQPLGRSDSQMKYECDILAKEKAKLEGIVGLTDPILCQLREKYIAAVNSDKFDEASKIFDLIERTEKKYRSEPAQVAVQSIPSEPEGQVQSPQKIIVQTQDAPSTGKQMRALGAMAAGLDGGMTPKVQNAWMSLIGLGDFIDASDRD